jgi:ACS family tartrate transporter-like MFS transporter
MPLTLMAAMCLAMGVLTAPWMVVSAYLVWVICQNAVQATFWLIPSDVLHGRSAAVGVAAIGSIGMVGSFVAPYAWGMAKDFTGSYQAGLLWLVASNLVAATIVLVARRTERSLRAARLAVANTV